MGHWNTQFTGHMINRETDQQGHNQPCVFYGSMANFPQPNTHSVNPAPENQCHLNFHRMPEHHGSALFYGMPQFNVVQLQHPGTNLDLDVGAQSNHYSPYLRPPYGIRDFPVQVNQGALDQLPLSTTHGVASVPTESFGRNISFMDGARGSFKRKTAEGAPAGYQYHTTSVGPSSSVAPMTVRPAESDVSLMDSSSFIQPEFVASEPASIVEPGSLRSVRNRLGMIGPASVPAHNANHFIQGNYVAPTVQLPGNPWFDMHFGANNVDMGTLAWVQAPNLPYVPAGVNGACVEARNIGFQGYQVTANSRSSGFLQPAVHQGHPGPHHPAQPMQAYNVAFPSQLALSSRRIPTIGSSSAGISPYQEVTDSGPAFLAPVPPTGFRLYLPHRREITLDQENTQRNFPHLRVLPEDEVAILEIPGYHEVGDSTDHHRDMRLDIDHMSYEELLALGEQIGSVGTGLSDEFIQRNLRIRIFSSSPARLNLEEAHCHDQQINFCVICQNDYEDEEHIGTLDCGHEYHRECIKKWLLVKNTCAVCKSTALTGKGKGSQ